MQGRAENKLTPNTGFSNPDALGSVWTVKLLQKVIWLIRKWFPTLYLKWKCTLAIFFLDNIDYVLLILYYIKICRTEEQRYIFLLNCTFILITRLYLLGTFKAAKYIHIFCPIGIFPTASVNILPRENHCQITMWEKALLFHCGYTRIHGFYDDNKTFQIQRL